MTYFQYSNWKRYNPSTDYAYPIAEGIDVNYFDAAMVTEYYGNAVEIGRFAREKYSNEGVDVLFPDNQDTEALTASKHYHNLIARNKLIEGKLKASTDLKSKGLDDAQTKMVIEEGLSIKHLSQNQNRESYLFIKLGDQGAPVWNLQKELLGLGYELPVDGSFGIETQRQLVILQEANNIYPSGVLDPDTFDLLFLIKK